MMKSCLQQLDSVSLRTLCLSKLHEKLIACMYTYIYIYKCTIWLMNFGNSFAISHDLDADT